MIGIPRRHEEEISAAIVALYATFYGRVAFQTETQDGSTRAVEPLTHRKVTAFLSANQTSPGVACELIFVDASPLRATGEASP